MIGLIHFNIENHYEVDRKEDHKTKTNNIMKLSDIYYLMKLKKYSLNATVKEEIEIYRSRLSKKGSSISIILNEDIDLKVSFKDVQKLCKMFINNELSLIELSYISDALQLSERVIFDKEETKNLIEEMSDFEINGTFTINRAMKIISL